MNTDSPDVSEHSRESTCRASNTSKSDFFTWIKLLIVPSWLVTKGCKREPFPKVTSEHFIIINTFPWILD